MQANYDPSMLQAYLNGEFTNLTTGQVYDRFVREDNIVHTIPSIQMEPLRIGVDFNIGNMSAVIGIKLGEKLLIIDEIVSAHDTDALAQEIIRRYPSNKIYVYPDASGGNRSTNAAKTDIQILESYGFTNLSAKRLVKPYVKIWQCQAVLCSKHTRGF